jgi:hypothetical protein
MRVGRSHLRCGKWAPALLAFTACAQSFNLDDGRGGVGIRVHEPPRSEPVQRRYVRLDEILPGSSPYRTAPAPFYLRLDEAHRFGPFALGDGAVVDIDNVRYVQSEVNDRVFSLIPPGGNQSLGPFECLEGAELIIGGQVLRVEQAGQVIRGHLDAGESVPATRLPVSLLALSSNSAPAVAQLRAAFLRIRRDLTAETAPLVLNAPTVRGMPGFRRDPVIRRSERDIVRAEQNADLRARQAFGVFLRSAGARTILQGRRDPFVFSGLPAGRYVVCAIADGRSENRSRDVRHRPLIWWADITLDGYQMAEVVFTPAEGRAWQNLFSD